MDRLLKIFTSLRLTVACLGLALLLVFIGTLAQVKLGLYTVQSEYFRSVFIYWHPQGTHWKIPIFPGGWLLGGILLLNLLAAHIKRFELSRKKTGLFLIHGGLILLLVGQFLTELFQVESYMRIEIGATRNYTEDGRRNELAVIDVTALDHDEVVSIPESFLQKGTEIREAKLPFSIRVVDLLKNSAPAGPRSGDASSIGSSEGIGKRLRFTGQAETAAMDDENKPTALLEIQGSGGGVGSWLVSTWLSKPPLLEFLKSLQLGSFLEERQTFQYAGRTYQLALRPVRYYKPYQISLMEFRHDVYKGTDIPKNFSSRIKLRNPGSGEDREVLIFMNNPLRYGGETFYQGGFEPGDKVSILQVVKNPAWLTPYLACTLVGSGLLVHFLMHLFQFAKKRRAAMTVEPSPRGKISKAKQRPEPALAGNRRRNS